MKKKTEKDLVKFMEGVIQEYTPLLFLEAFRIKIKKDNEVSKTIMSCEFVYPYMNATIYWHDSALKKFQAGENLTGHVVHELCHLVTDPFYSKAVSRYIVEADLLDEREHLTERIAHIVLKLNKALPD